MAKQGLATMSVLDFEGGRETYIAGVHLKQQFLLFVRLGMLLRLLQHLYPVLNNLQAL